MNATNESELAALSAMGDQAQNAERHSLSRVIDIRRWTANVFSLRLDRPEGFRFTPGHYARLGLADKDGTLLWRPFSMVNGRDEAVLEFVMVLVPDGVFSQCLRTLSRGSEILVEHRSLGFLTLDQLASGKDLWMIASGTGIGPFVSMLRSPAHCDQFEDVVLVHSVRHADELTYQDELRSIVAGTRLRGRFHYLQAVTRDDVPGTLRARVPALIQEGSLQQAAGVDLNVDHSRAMVCGNPDMCKDVRASLTRLGFQPGRRNVPGQMAFEKYW
jgi:ferredoxin/flavodoxin---NADP+ reductase